MDIELNILEKWIRESDNVVFITGKDFSAEAGFPDYRAMDEGYLERYKYPRTKFFALPFSSATPSTFTGTTGSASCPTSSPPSPAPPTRP